MGKGKGKIKVDPKAIRSAYIRVMAITPDEANKPEHQHAIDNALKELWQYDGLFEGEDDALMDIRLDMQSPAEGNASDLANHFRKLNPKELSSFTAWEVIFTVYSRMKDKLNLAESESTEDIVVDQTSVEDGKNEESVSSDITINKDQNIQEERKMPSFDELTAKMKNAAGNTGAMPQAKGAMKEAARNAVIGDKAIRTANSENSFVTKFVLASRPLSQRLVDKENPMGTVANPQKQLENFKKRFGVEVAADGTVTFTKAVDTQDNREAALQIYNTLMQACEDPETKVKVGVGKSLGSLKGADIKKADGSEVTMKSEDVIKFLTFESLGWVRVPKDNILVHLGKVKSNTKKATEGLQDTAIESISAVTVLKINNRSELLSDESMVKYVKEINKEKHNQTTGAKSEISAKYISDKLNKKGEPKQMGYKIPLVTDLYELEVVEGLKEIFPVGAGIGAKALVYGNEEDAAKIQDTLAEIIAVLAEGNYNDGEGAMEEIRATATATAAADTQAQSADFAE